MKKCPNFLQKKKNLFRKLLPSYVILHWLLEELKYKENWLLIECLKIDSDK